MLGKRDASQNQDDSAVVGGYMLHSPQARLATARLAVGYLVFTILIAVLLAVHTRHFSLVTALVFAICLVLLPMLRLVHWQTLPPLSFVPFFWLAGGIYVVMAFDFREPDVLLSLYTTATLFATIFWYKRWLMILHLCAIFGVFSAASLMIAGGHELATVLLSVPLMALIAVRLGRTSNHYLGMLLRRKRLRATVRSLLHALHARDGYTAEHSEVALRMAVGVAEQLGLDEDEQAELTDVALLHDIGKIGIPHAILNKPGKLDEREWEIMRQHPVIGEQILADVPGFENIARAVRHEHERWDGAGYPDGLAGDEIPRASRIVLACDAYHAMTSDRPYRDAMPDEDARAELLQHAGTQFDPQVVPALLRALDDGVMVATPEDRGGTRAAEEAEETFTSVPGAPAQSIVAETGARPEHGPKRTYAVGRSGDGEGDDVDPSNDHTLMMRAAVVTWLLSAAVLSVFLVAFSKVDLFGIAALAGAFAIAIVSLLVAHHRSAKAWFEVTALLACIVTPIAAAYYREPAMMLFLVTPATSAAGFFWRSRLIRALQIAVVTFEFMVLPIVLFGFDEFPRALVGTRAFVGAMLVVGYLSSRMSAMEFERERFSSTAASLLLALHARDGYTAVRSSETVAMALGVAERLDVGGAERNELANIAILHDIGKIGIPDEILHKPGKLDDHEWEIVRRHPVIGEQIVAHVPGFDGVARAIRHKQERWDGNGYPDGLRGWEIPLASRIVLACDAYHAMTSDRPYRPTMSDGEARAELLGNSGTQFDPKVIKALIDTLDDSDVVLAAQEPYVEAANRQQRVTAA